MRGRIKDFLVTHVKIRKLNNTEDMNLGQAKLARGSVDECDA